MISLLTPYFKEFIQNVYDILVRLNASVAIWGAWLIVPFFVEFVPAFFSMFTLRRRRRKWQKRPELVNLPDITIIIPVYDSKDTLFKCIESIDKSSYPNHLIKILLIDNKGSVEDFEVFADTQDAFPTLHMQWMNSMPGKSKAMNMALYNSEGKYIINVDSDGYFEKDAIMHMIEKFENDSSIACVTGTILTSPEQINLFYPTYFRRLLRRLEFMEYAQAFLAGRSYNAEHNNIYTLSGAFSAFRKSAILASQLYNTDTICEDTQMTFQMKYLYNYRVDICEDAIFFVDPIESLNKLYTQRQRWQRGSLEVSKLFENKMKMTHIFTDVNVRTVLYDHSFAFPRLMWYIVTLYFIFTNYSTQILIWTNIFVYIMYVVIGWFYYLNAVQYIKPMPNLCKYYKYNRFLLLLLPLYSFMIYFFRIAGIINSINTDSVWKTNNFKDEAKSIKRVIRKDLGLKNEEK